MLEPVIFSAAEDSFDLAVAELKEALGGKARVERFGPDVGVVTAEGVTIDEVAERCAAQPIVFVKHLSALTGRLAVSDRPDPQAVAAAALASIGELPATVAVQAWVSGESKLGYGSAEAYSAITARLREQGCTPSRAGQSQVISCCLTPRSILLGYNSSSVALSDWPGGRVRLSRGPQQVSRAEFKLEEMLQAFPVELPGQGVAVDFGAAPGGWTRILRQQGLRVIAVDPGDLDAPVATDRGVSHLRTTAGEFLRSHTGELDMAVNDMRMDPRLSSELMVQTARLLKPGAPAVVTLKTGTGAHVLRIVHDCLDLLDAQYTVVGARQLHHNRHEITVVLRKRSRRRTAGR